MYFAANENSVSWYVVVGVITCVAISAAVLIK